MLDPINKTIEVRCSQEQAFRVFVNDMGSWWPLGQALDVNAHRQAGKVIAC